MYCTDSCPYCTMAKNLLDSKDVEYEVIDVGTNSSLWEAMTEKTGRRTVPQIFIGEHHVGGFDDLSDSNQSGELDGLLKELKNV